MSQAVAGIEKDGQNHLAYQTPSEPDRVSARRRPPDAVSRTGLELLADRVQQRVDGGSQLEVEVASIEVLGPDDRIGKTLWDGIPEELVDVDRIQWRLISVEVVEVPVRNLVVEHVVQELVCQNRVL